MPSSTWSAARSISLLPPSPSWKHSNSKPMLTRILQRLTLRLRRTVAEHQAAFFIGAVALVAFVLLSSRLEGIGLPIPGSGGGVKISPPAVTAVSGTVEAAIQGVILRGNQEQERAVANRNMTLMQDTATDSYY